LILLKSSRSSTLEEFWVSPLAAAAAADGAGGGKEKFLLPPIGTTPVL
jgi:hypothetical protein